MLRLLGASLWVAALRFALIGLAADWLPALVLAQLLHAVTFGVHHSAAVATLQRWFEPAQQGRAQALYVTIGYGLGGALGVLAASWVWTAVSPQAVFVVSAAAAALALGASVVLAGAAPGLSRLARSAGLRDNDR